MSSPGSKCFFQDNIRNVITILRVCFFYCSGLAAEQSQVRTPNISFKSPGQRKGKIIYKSSYWVQELFYNLFCQYDANFTCFISYSDTFNRVQDMYLNAARLQPSLDLDPDVQTGLGVLLNLSGDFDKVWSLQKRVFI